MEAYAEDKADLVCEGNVAGLQSGPDSLPLSEQSALVNSRQGRKFVLRSLSHYEDFRYWL